MKDQQLEGVKEVKQLDILYIFSVFLEDWSQDLHRYQDLQMLKFLV
jgi:hypothetical protein